MSEIAIRVEGLSKRYRLGRKRERYRMLRDSMAGSLVSLIRGTGALVRKDMMRPAGPDEAIWALNGVSLEIRRGEVVGVIGRNGAGKSTLLKILSMITEPTAGFAEIHGRMGSLLEVGTGFHYELTGRENVYLNGAILGMKRAEIKRRFDEIVAFAEVERFLDTPVKHYSSGMYLRLAFAVAAHLEPEILLVDEVLAVGDARFQKKCLNKMQDVGRQGRTVLFVSHNMSAITRLCERTILLEEGNVLQDGPSHQVVSAYLDSGNGSMAVREWIDPARAPGRGVARLRAVRVRTGDGQTGEAMDITRPVGIEMEYDVLSSGYVLLPNIHFVNEEGVHLFSTHDIEPDWRGRPRPAGRYTSTVWVPGNLLNEGRISVAVGLQTEAPRIFQFYETDVVAFRVIENAGMDGDSARGDYSGRIAGAVRPLLRWATLFEPKGPKESA